MKAALIHAIGKAKEKIAVKIAVVHIYAIAHTYTSSSTISGSTIFSQIWSWISSLGSQIVSSLGGLFAQIFSGFGQSVVMMFQSFGFSMSQYGVWAPVMFVVGIGAAMLVGYLLLDFIDAEKDVTGLEDDL
ncbi:hypothetical protein [Caldiplasma sukawensis]